MRTLKCTEATSSDRVSPFGCTLAHIELRCIACSPSPVLTPPFPLPRSDSALTPQVSGPGASALTGRARSSGGGGGLINSEDPKCKGAGHSRALVESARVSWANSKINAAHATSCVYGQNASTFAPWVTG